MRHKWKWAAATVVAAVAVAWCVHALAERPFDWRLAARAAAGLRWNWLLAAVALAFATYAGRALRWAVFLKPLGSQPGFGSLLSATAIGFAAITIFGRAGEFVRPYLIARKAGVPVSSQMAAWVLERIFDLLMALLLFGFALARVQASGIHTGPRLAWVIAAGGRIVFLACLALFVVLLLLRHIAEPLRARLMGALAFLPPGKLQKVEKLVSAFVQGLEATRSDGALIAVFFYSVLEWVLIAACYWSLTQAFPATAHFTVVDVLIFLGFVSFGAAVQIPGIGGGIQVVSVLVLTELFGLRLEVATSFALLVWLLTLVVIVPVGLVLAFREGLDWRGLRRMGSEVAE